MIGRLGSRLVRVIDVQHVFVAVGIWVLLTVVSLALVLRVVLALPADHFAVDRPARAEWTVRRVGRNVAGIGLIVVGVVLSLPGVPGQGVLTILAGVLLVDFPRRRHVERALFGRPGVLSRLNKLRARFGRPPLQPPDS